MMMTIMMMIVVLTISVDETSDVATATGGDGRKDDNQDYDDSTHVHGEDGSECGGDDRDDDNDDVAATITGAVTTNLELSSLQFVLLLLPQLPAPRLLHCRCSCSLHDDEDDNHDCDHDYGSRLLLLLQLLLHEVASAASF